MVMDILLRLANGCIIINDIELVSARRMLPLEG